MKKAIKTLEANSLLCLRFAPKSINVDTNNSLLFLWHNFFFFWQRGFHHAPSTRINSKHDSLFSGGFRREDMKKLVAYYEHNKANLNISFRSIFFFSSFFSFFHFLLASGVVKMKENPTHLILSTYLNRKLNFYGCHVNENGRRLSERKRNDAREFTLRFSYYKSNNHSLGRGRSFMAFNCQSYSLIAVSMPYLSSTDLMTSASFHTTKSQSLHNH